MGKTIRESFIHLVKLKTFQRTHIGDKPYTCSEFGKSFIFSANLKIYEQTHNRETQALVVNTEIGLMRLHT